MDHQKFDDAVNLPSLQAKLVFQSLPDIILVREGELHVFRLDLNLKFQPFDAAATLSFFFGPSKMSVGTGCAQLVVFGYGVSVVGEVGIFVLELQYFAKFINRYVPYTGIAKPIQELIEPLAIDARAFKNLLDGDRCKVSLELQKIIPHRWMYLDIQPPFIWEIFGIADQRKQFPSPVFLFDSNWFPHKTFNFFPEAGI